MLKGLAQKMFFLTIIAWEISPIKERLFLTVFLGVSIRPLHISKDK